MTLEEGLSEPGSARPHRPSLPTGQGCQGALAITVTGRRESRPTPALTYARVLARPALSGPLLLSKSGFTPDLQTEADATGVRLVGADEIVQ